MSDIDLTAPEVQAAITAAVEKATAPLLAKRDELLGEVKKLRKNAEIDPADLERVEAERDELRAQLADANKAAKAAAKAVEEANKRAEAAEGSTTKLLADNALVEALSKAGITNPVHQKAVKAMFAGDVQVVADGDSKVARIGDKSVVDALTEWAATDEGKHFVAAPDITGGGSQGGHAKPNSSGKLPDVNDRAGRAAVFAKRMQTAAYIEE